MKKNKYLLLLSSIGVLLLLLVAAFQENFGKEWRRIQNSGHSDEGPLSVQLRQIVNPSLKVTDRCVTCHVSMGPGEEAVTGSPLLAPHKRVVHDPAEYGCTICHAGQGQASEKADAHGEVSFWPDPMLSAAYSYAGCGACHAPLKVPGQESLSRATAAFERLDCLACHRVDGRGGTVRPDGGGMEGADLSRVGITGYDAGWYEKHLAKAAAAAKGPWQTSFGPISEAERPLLALFLSTRVAAPKLIEAKAVFHSAGCLGCHKVSGVGGDEGPDLSREGEKDPGQMDFAQVPGNPTRQTWFAEHFRSPAGIVSGSQMPPVSASDRDIDALTMYVSSLRRQELPGSYMPKDRVLVARFGEREFAPDGETVFGAFCTGCHGSDGRGRRAPGAGVFPAIMNPDFLELASDDFLAATVTKGRPGRRMLAWGEKDGGLKAEEIRQLVGYIRQSSGVQMKPDALPRRWVQGDLGSGQRLYTASCAGCHGVRGQGGEGPALNNKTLLESATDTYLVETVSRGRRGTAMQGFLTPSTVRATLTKEEIESVIAFIRSWEGRK